MQRAVAHANFLRSYCKYTQKSLTSKKISDFSLFILKKL